MPPKIRELKAMLLKAGLRLLPTGKGSHRQYGHPSLIRPVTISGHDGDDAKRYQEQEVHQAIATVKKARHEKEH